MASQDKTEIDLFLFVIDRVGRTHGDRSTNGRLSRRIAATKRQNVLAKKL